MKRHVRRAAGKASQGTRRAGYLLLGWLMLALGVIGAFLPLMPTTIFLIAAAWCFGRSSPRAESWLLGHPRFGPTLRDWREQGAIPRQAKLAAYAGMALGYGLFLFGRPGALPAISAAVFVGAGALYVATRPDPRPKPARDQRRDYG
ncbi:YbaN family protein [Aminobacter sp. HY435]|uniref:YbaN family protein n=1 Tax=Aminobacter sp. HY435 TaxID=2970917 RepID=UPI0022B95558|nr:YbaN family protein [Aminobacter sp. HY435]